jgi:hypothetical protein
LDQAPTKRKAEDENHEQTEKKSKGEEDERTVTTAPISLKVGASVRFRNCVTHQSFNGTVGTVAEQSEDGRWHISMGGKARGYNLRYVKELNLEVMPDELPPLPPPPGTPPILARSVEQDIEADV